MALFGTEDRRFAAALSRLAYCNPFLPERFELEREALGEAYEAEKTAVWSRQFEGGQTRSNVRRLAAESESLAERVRATLIDGAAATPGDLELYEDLSLYVVYYRFISPFVDSGDTLREIITGGAERVAVWPDFLKGFHHFFRLPGHELPNRHDAAHVFACLFQVRRAFWHIFDNIVGESMPIARLRAAVWQSIFTYDMRRYRRSLYDRMSDVPTLVTGPSGTGKELVARAIGLSQFVAFDGKRQCFTADVAQMFLTLNLSALSPTLIESELFGHCKGAFTGAVADRTGWLELAGSSGTVFLDEIGELDPAIQVKLLRVVQSRVFERLGETEQRRFHGKIITATNRDLAAEIRAGRFREDFYYRLCADQIGTVPLCEQLSDSPNDITDLVTYISARIAGDDAAELAAETMAWIAERLADYDWPGNIRELEQCVRNVMIRGEYRPRESLGTVDDTQRAWLREAGRGRLSADDLLAHYCLSVYRRLGSYEATARSLGLDRRTVKRKVERIAAPKS